MSFKISLAGDQGSGKSTVAKILLERTGASYYSTGSFARRYAAEMGMDIAAFNVYSETHPEIDREIDRALIPLGDDPRDMIVDSRMAWHFVRGSFRVYMFADPVESARRILRDKRETESFSTLDEAILSVRARRDSEIKRYREFYGVNIKDPENYSLLVDATYATPEQVADCILNGLERYLAYPELKAAYICPRHLYYPKKPLLENMLSAFTTAFEMGSFNIPPVTVCERDSKYYITDSPESAIVCARMGVPHVAFVRTDKMDESIAYSTLENI